MKRTADRGVRCPDCGSAGLRVLRTNPRDGFTVRRLACRCGGRVTTVERPVTGRPSTPVDADLVQLSIADFLRALREAGVPCSAGLPTPPASQPETPDP